MGQKRGLLKQQERGMFHPIKLGRFVTEGLLNRLAFHPDKHLQRGQGTKQDEVRGRRQLTG